MADITGSTTQQDGSKTNPIIAESDFSYEVPNPDPGFDLKAASDEFFAKLAGGDVEGLEADEVEEPIEAGEAGEAGEPVEGVESPKPEPEAEPDLDPKYARGIERVVAREMAAKEAEQAARREREAAEARLAELKKYEGLKPTAELAELMDLDPVGAFKSLGKDPDTMIKLALAQQLGDKAPAELKEFAKKAADDLRFKRLEAKLAEKEQLERATAYFNTVQTGAREYVTGLDKEIDPKKPGKKVGDSTPTVTLLAKADPDYVHGEIMEEIVKEARVKAATDPNGDPISYEEAARRVETRLSKLAKLLVPNGNPTAGKNVSKPSNPVPPSIKPAAKPLPPWQKRTSSVEEDGLKEALRVYEREEAARKARR